jgi:hypothetical protein
MTGANSGLPTSYRIHLLRAAWLVAFAALSAAPAFKFGDVQLLEVIQVARLSLVLLLLIAGGLKIPNTGLWREFGGKYGLFLFGCAVISILALRLPFFPPPNIGFLKRPLVLSASRICELFLAVYCMLAVAESLRQDALQRSSKFRLVLDVYCGVAVLSALLSIAGVLLLELTGISTPIIYGPESRVRGFFNEGGPYGMFLVSAILAWLLRARVAGSPRRLVYWGAHCLMSGALLASRSKVAALAVLCLSLGGTLFAGSRRQRLALAGVLSLVLAVLIGAFGGKFLGYFYSYANFDELLYYRPDDPSLIMGRVTGALILPRMAAAHPILGVGLGNYSLMRNDPAYLQDLPSVDEWDLPGLGLLGSSAELGIPLTLGFFALLLLPLRHAWRREASPLIVAVAVFQPVAFLLGVNLNFFYPWLMAAFALAATCGPLGVPARPQSMRSGLTNQTECGRSDEKTCR